MNWSSPKVAGGGVALLLLLVWFIVWGTFLPLIPVVQGLTDSAAKPTGSTVKPGGHIPAPLAARIMSSPVTPGFAVALGLACVLLAARGIWKGPGARAYWVVLLVISVVLFLQSAGLATVVPQFKGMFGDLGWG